MDAYATLGVSPGDSDACIKAAWKAKARALHPDCSTGDTEDMARLNAAYDAIKTQKRRAAYDCALGQGLGEVFEQGAESLLKAFDEVFADLFGTRTGPPAKGADVGVSVTIPFEAPLRPTPVTITGHDGQARTLHIPRGVHPGHTLRLKGHGAPGPGGAGDLLVRVTCTPHPVFGREREALLCPKLHVPFVTAVLGGALTLEGLDGTPLVVEIPEGTQTGDQIRVEGAGFPPFGGGPRGPLLITAFVPTPTGLTLAQKEQVRGWMATA